MNVVRPETGFDFRNPDYVPIFQARTERLMRLRKDPSMLKGLKRFYAADPAQFIEDWALTVDPRVATMDDGKGGKRSPIMPFLLFPKQRELITWMLEGLDKGQPGIVEKSRDVGASWLGMALSCVLCLFREDIMIGVGSAKEDKLDRSGDPDTLFWKARAFLSYVPAEFRGGWDLKKHSAHMRIQFPGTGSSITGEAGDNIGRGGRKLMYIVDESAHIERPQLIDASLAATTDCRVDMSSVNGPANPFAQKRHSGKYRVFTFGWRDDPRKDDAWYEKKCNELDPIIVAQEIDLNYSASVEGVIVPSQWVQAAIDAHVKLKIKPTGIIDSALDVADEGRDKNAWARRHGVLLTHCVQWAGINSDIHHTTTKAFGLCDEHGVRTMAYDADGMGVACRGDARTINADRAAAKRHAIRVSEYRGSAGVLYPLEYVKGPDGKPTDRRNEDYYLNRAAQDWFALRFRFQQTFRAVNGLPYDPDDIISIDSTLPEITRLTMELSQPTYDQNTAGKMKIAKAPDGTNSPNLADAVRMLFCVRRRGLAISDSVLANA